MRSLVEWTFSGWRLVIPTIPLVMLLRCQKAESDVPGLVGAWHAQTARNRARHDQSDMDPLQNTFDLGSLQPSFAGANNFDSIAASNLKLT